MPTMETFEEFIGGGGNVGKRNPRIFVSGEIFPAYEIFVTLSDFATIEDRVNVQGGIGIFGEDERSGRRMWMEVGWVVVGLEKGDMKDGMETGEVGRETEFVHEIG